MKKKALFLLLFILVLVVTLLTGCGAGRPATQMEAEKIIPVEIAEAYLGDIQLTSTFLGTIHPRQSVNITPKVSGKIAQVNVQDGDVVKAGEVLVQLDATDISGQVSQAEVAYQLALLQLAKVKAGTRSEQLEQSRAALSIAQSQYDAAKLNFERTDLLYQAGAVPKQQLEQAQTQYQVAAAQLKQAEESFRMAETGAAPEDIKIAEAQAAQAEISLRNARTQLDNTVITAPISGVVSGVTAKPGEMAGPSIPVAMVNQLDMVEVQVNLTEKDINRVKKDQEVAVLVPAASSKPFKGKIISISPVADPRTKTFLLKAEVANEDGLLKGGMSASIKIVTEEEKGGIVVPSQAVLQQNGEQVVFVLAGEAVARRTVKLGMSNDVEVIITAGLAKGEKIVVKGQHYLEEGSKVTIAGGEEPRK